MIYFLLTLVVIVGILFYLNYSLSSRLESKQAQMEVLIANFNAKTAGYEYDVENLKTRILELSRENEELAVDFNEELERNNKVLSQKKSQEVRTGQITEHLVPFLDKCAYNPKYMHFLGEPVDYLVYDIDSADPAIIFLEVKTGNATLSKRQKLIKGLVQTGKVRFEEFTLNEKGAKVRVTKNEV